MNIDLPASLSHAYLVTGGSGESRAALAKRLTAAYLCEGDGPVPCGVCRHCRKVAEGIHPDVTVLGPPPDRREIGVDQARTLRSDAYIRPNEGKRKVYIVDPADAMNPAAQNALLKVLEDGPAYAAFLLLAAEPGRLLDTVRSRCEPFPLPPEETPVDPELAEQAEALAELLLTGDEFAVAKGLTALELERPRADQLAALLGEAENQIARRLAAHPARGARVLRALKARRENAVFNPGAGHTLGWIAAALFREA